jgi:hypothetical protein
MVQVKPDSETLATPDVITPPVNAVVRTKLHDDMPERFVVSVAVRGMRWLLCALACGPRRQINDAVLLLKHQCAAAVQSRKIQAPHAMPQ